MSSTAPLEFGRTPFPSSVTNVPVGVGVPVGDLVLSQHQKNKIGMITLAKPSVALCLCGKMSLAFSPTGTPTPTRMLETGKKWEWDNYSFRETVLGKFPYNIVLIIWGVVTYVIHRTP